MKKLTKIMAVLLCTGMLFGCDTEVAEFDSVKDAVETAKQEEKEAVKNEEKIVPKEKTEGERLKNPDTFNFENNEELKRLLTTSVSDEEYDKFFNANKYNIVEFDGAIDVIELIEGKKTRYTLLLRAGDYDPNTVIGPAFKIKDVGASDQSVRDLFLSGNGEVGKNVKIKAKIYGFDANTGLVELKLESMILR